MSVRDCSMRQLLGYAALVALIAGCASADKGARKDVVAHQGQYSGFLSDYSQLSVVTDARGNELLRWINPDVNLKNYHKVIVSESSPTYFPKPEATAQVSAQVLREIQGYGRKRLLDSLDQAGLLADAPGPGVASANLALTGVASAAQKLKPREVIPVALIKAGIEGATGTRQRDVKLFVEAEIVDSVTNQVLARSVREGTGVPLKGTSDPLTLDHFKPKIDQWADGVVEEAHHLLQ